VGKFKNYASSGCRTFLIQFETGDSSPYDWNMGVEGACNGLGIKDGNFFVEQVGHGARMVIDTCGRVGIGTIAPNSSLCVVGKLSGDGIVGATSDSGIGVHGSSVNGTAVFGGSCSGNGVFGATSSTSLNAGVKGYAPPSCGCTLGVCGQSNSLKGIGVRGWNLASGGIAVEGLAGSTGAIPFVAKGHSCQTANLQ